MVENKQNWWKPAVEVFTQISGWIVAPIIFALVFGKMLDTRYGTKPLIFLAFAGIGFLITCVGIVKVIKKYMKEIKDLAEENKNGSR